jgi:nucleotide-binding universal stress UspA family protein
MFLFKETAMVTIGRILCAIDLEKASERAFDRALNLAIISEAKLHILHATPASVPFSWRARERLRYLTELRERAEAAGVKVRVDEQHGDPARVIVLHANARKMDLVVLGSNRRRGWRRLREGSVSERVLRRAAWPVLIVPWDARRAGVLDKKRSREASKRARESRSLPHKAIA